MKYLRVIIGSKVYDIPLHVIANTFKHEYNLVMDNSDVAKGWASGNMDWVDVVEHAVEIVAKPLEDPHKLWCNAEKSIVEK
jgi:hypothetical protein